MHRLTERELRRRVTDAASALGGGETQAGIAQAAEQFGHMLSAFQYGAPPHGGIAWGFDRLVAILAGETNIREVIAFPKALSGADPMTGAPADVPAESLDELGIRTT